MTADRKPPRDGGPAFPVHRPFGEDGRGMSLRDWFAGQALAGILASNARATVGPDMERITAMVADVAYRTADAMLAASIVPEAADE